MSLLNLFDLKSELAGMQRRAHEGCLLMLFTKASLSSSMPCVDMLSGAVSQSRAFVTCRRPYIKLRYVLGLCAAA
jgi:hypothetical protein